MTLNEGGATITTAASGFSASLSQDTTVADYTRATGPTATIGLPSGLMGQLSDPSTRDKVAVGLGVAGYAQGAQGLSWRVKSATGTNGYADVKVDLFWTPTAACDTAVKADAAAGVSLAYSGTGLNDSTTTAWRQLVSSDYSTSTTPTPAYLCAVFTNPGSWSTSYSSTATATGTDPYDGATTTSNEATWSAIVDPAPSSLDGDGAITVEWTTFLPGQAPA